MIRKIEKRDISQVCDIYNYYIQNTIVTFEEEPVSLQEMENRVKEVTETFPWMVFEENGRILGYTYAGKWNKREAYRFTVEPALYIIKDFVGTGIGSQLFSALLKELKRQGIHSVIAIISQPNEPSVILLEKFGFKKVAHFTQVGYKFNHWIDVGHWQLVL